MQYRMILGGLRDKGGIQSSVSLDTISATGAYNLGSNHPDSPVNGAYAIMAVYSSSPFAVQLVSSASDSTTFLRVSWGGVWKAWKEL